LTEDIPYGLAAWSRLGEQVGVDTPTMKALVTLANAALQQDFWQMARTPAQLGLAGLDKFAMLDYVA
jgi:hypothetical protein